MNIPNPKYLILKLTNQCNAFCKTCDYWKNANLDTLDIVDCLKIIKNFSILSPNGLVYLTGGEPFTTDFNQIKIILEFCFKLNLKVQIETNGINFLPFYEKYSDLCNSSITNLKLSLNSLDKNIHNNHCGISNSFEIQHEIINQIKSYRKKEIKTPILWCNTLLGISLETFLDTYHYSKQLFDIFSFDLYLHILGNEQQKVIFNERVIRHYIKIFDYFLNHPEPYLVNSSREIKEKKEYLLKGQNIKIARKCLSPLNNIMINNSGVISLCWNCEDQVIKPEYNYNEIGNIKTTNLIELFQNINFIKYREQLYNTCKKWCMIKQSYNLYLNN